MELLKSFVTVAESGVITEAAGELMISQSALSRRLHQLERDLGTTLLHRRHDGVELTDAGRDVLTVGRQLLDRYDLLRQQLGQRDRLERGSIRVGGGATATSFVLQAASRRSMPTIPG